MFKANEDGFASVKLVDLGGDVEVQIDGLCVAMFQGETGRLVLRELNDGFDCISHFLAVDSDGFVVVERDGETFRDVIEGRDEQTGVTEQAEEEVRTMPGSFVSWRRGI